MISLSRACQDGDLNEFLKCLEQGDDIKSITQDGNSLLHMCSNGVWVKSKEDEMISIMKILIDKGLDINLRNKRGETPLYLASIKMWLKGTKFLLDKGANINVRDNQNHSPLAAACWSEINCQIVKLLLEYGACVEDIDCLTVRTIARTRNSSTLGFLMDYGFNLNALSHSQKCSKDDTCLVAPLQVALNNNDVKMASLLIQGGANVKARFSDGLYSIHRIAATGNTDLLALALEKGADVDSLCPKNETPLCWACFTSKLNVVKMLIEKGANTSHRNIKGESLMPYAIKGGNLEIVKLLRSVDVPFEKICEDRFFPANLEFTPLSMAAYFNHIDIFNYLLEVGFDINEKESNGLFVIHMAAMGQSVDVVKRILFLGVNVDLPTDKGETAISIAFERGCTELCFMLTVWCNANLKFQMKEGTSIIEEAIRLTYYFGHPYQNPIDNEYLNISSSDRGNIPIIQQVLRLRAAGLAFTNDLLKNLTHFIDDGSFFSNCTKEISSMKQISINENLSLYDFLCSDLTKCYKIVKYNENEKILMSLKPFKDFPSYGPMLSYKLIRSVRLKHLRKVANLFFESVGFNSKLSYDCINILVTYFDIPSLMQFEIYFSGSNVPFTEIDWPLS